MRRPYPILVTMACAILLAACSASSTSKPEASTPAAKGVVDDRPCAQNYTQKGTIWTSREFRTFEEFSGVSPAQAFDLLAAEFVSKGMNVTQLNKELGIITAAPSVRFGDGETVPVNLLVKKLSGGGSRIEMVFLVGMGMMVVKSPKDEFCSLVAPIRDLQVAAKASQPKQMSKKK